MFSTALIELMCACLCDLDSLEALQLSLTPRLDIYQAVVLDSVVKLPVPVRGRACSAP